MARPIRVTPKPHSTMPVAIVARLSVMTAGASNGAEGSAAAMRSVSDAANIPATAAVELSGPAIAKGSELPRPITLATTADEMCQIAPKCDPLFAAKNDPFDGAETGGAEPHIAEQSRSWRAASGEREVMRGS